MASKPTNETLAIRGRLKEKNKKREKGISKRPKSLGKSKEKYWTCGKVGHSKEGISKETTRKREIKIRMILRMSLKNPLGRTKEMSLLRFWKTKEGKVHG